MLKTPIQAFFFLCVFTLFLFQTLPAQGRELSLAVALDLAAENATELVRLQGQQRLARGTHLRTSRAFLPGIKLETSWFRADADWLENIPTFSMQKQPLIATHDRGPVEGSISAINITQPLIHMEAWKGRAQAHEVVEARAFATDWGKLLLKLKTAQSYFAIAVQDAVLHAARQALQANQHALKTAAKNYANGMVGKLDVARAEAETQNAWARVYAAEGQLCKTQADLAVLLGLNPVEVIRTTTALPEPLPAPQYKPPPQKRSDIAGNEQLACATELGIDKAQARFYPQINLVGRQQWAEGDSLLEDYTDGWLVGVNLQWNLFEGMDRSGEIAEARARHQLAQTNLTEKTRAATRAQYTSLNDWVASWSAWHASIAALNASETAAALSSRRYEEGLGNLTDLLLSRAELYQRQVDMKKYQYLTLLASMNYYLQHGYNPLQGLPPSALTDINPLSR